MLQHRASARPAKPADTSPAKYLALQKKPKAAAKKRAPTSRSQCSQQQPQRTKTDKQNKRDAEALKHKNRFFFKKSGRSTHRDS
jgi:hypothetical protein